MRSLPKVSRIVLRPENVRGSHHAIHRLPLIPDTKRKISNFQGTDSDLETLIMILCELTRTPFSPAPSRQLVAKTLRPIPNRVPPFGCETPHQPR